MNNIPFIIFTNPLKNNSRKLMVLEGFPFYQSTGNQSTLPGTFFPFLGIQRDYWSASLKKIASRQLLKPTQVGMDLEQPLINQLTQKILAHKDGSPTIVDELLKRLCRTQFVLISAWIGEGFWTSNLGKEIKDYLMDQY